MNLTVEQRKQLKLVEIFLVNIKNDNEETLAAAKKCKQYLSDKYSKNYDAHPFAMNIVIH